MWPAARRRPPAEPQGVAPATAPPAGASWKFGLRFFNLGFLDVYRLRLRDNARFFGILEGFVGMLRLVTIRPFGP